MIIKSLFIAYLFFGLAARADIHSADMENIQCRIGDGKEFISLDKLSVEGTLFSVEGKDQLFTIEREENTLDIISGEWKSRLKIPVEELNKFELDDAGLKLKAKKSLDVTVERLLTDYGNKLYNMEQLSVSCRRSEEGSVRSLCLAHTTRARLKLLSVPKEAAKSVQSLLAVPASAIPVRKPPEKHNVREFNDLRMDISKEKFKFQGDIGYLGGITLKARGTLVYDEAANVITAVLQSARVGLVFSVKERVLKALKDMESEAFKVEEDKITIFLNKFSFNSGAESPPRTP